ncbi:hypothetical protein D3C85_1026110 [compost metagenome]
MAIIDPALARIPATCKLPLPEIVKVRPDAILILFALPTLVSEGLLATPDAGMETLTKLLGTTPLHQLLASNQSELTLPVQ